MATDSESLKTVRTVWAVWLSCLGFSLVRLVTVKFSLVEFSWVELSLVRGVLGHSGLLSRRVSQCLQLFTSASTLKLNCCACCLVLPGAASACWSCRRHWQQLRFLFGSSLCFGWFHSLLCGGRHPHTPPRAPSGRLHPLPSSWRVASLFCFSCCCFCFYNVLRDSRLRSRSTDSLSLVLYLPFTLFHPFLLFLHLFIRCKG